MTRLFAVIASLARSSSFHRRAQVGDWLEGLWTKVPDQLPCYKLRMVRPGMMMLGGNKSTIGFLRYANDLLQQTAHLLSVTA
jgi:hypothetical protein